MHLHLRMHLHVHRVCIALALPSSAPALPTPRRPALAQVYAKAGKHSKPPVSLHGQLLWREFYYVCGHGTPHFDRMEGNPICKQIPWESDAALLSAWSEGRTGYPWIDACMTQLRGKRGPKVPPSLATAHAAIHCPSGPPALLLAAL